MSEFPSRARKLFGRPRGLSADWQFPWWRLDENLYLVETGDAVEYELVLVRRDLEELEDEGDELESWTDPDEAYEALVELGLV